MWSKIKRFLLELVTDFFSFVLPYFIIGFLIHYSDNGFTPEQQKTLGAIFGCLMIWSYWNGKDNEHRIKSLEHEVAVLNGEIPF